MDQINASTSTAATHAVDRLFPGEGEMARLMRARDWSRTPLGPIDNWPQSLQTAVSICLASRFPMLIWWGPQFVALYNDAYRPMLGVKHPESLGAPGKHVWHEIWHIIGPMLEGVLREGIATWSDDQYLPLERNGYPEECYFTFSYSPIREETGAVGGVFTAVTETTQRVLSERRALLARDLAATLVDAHSTEEVSARAARTLANDPADIPIVLLYGIDTQAQQATLIDTAGIAPGTLMSPRTVSLDGVSGKNRMKRQSPGGRNPGDPWSLARASETGREVLARNIDWGNISPDVEPRLKPHSMLTLPLIEPGKAEPTMILVAGVSPQLELDTEYQTFYRLIASHLATALASAHAYEAERQRAEALAELDRAKTLFFSNVSHEFRTPLTLILGPLDDSLADPQEPLSPRQRERLEIMRRNGARLLKLVNTLLDFARIEAGRIQAVYAPTDLATYTAELASGFRSLIEKAGLRFAVDCSALHDLPVPVYVDREMWEKIVLNLLSNAFKFTFSGSISIALRAVREGDQAVAVELIVRDTGTGIPASELPHIFRRFYRVEGARSRSHEGSGIGLALVQQLVRLHGGTIRAESREGEGTSFFVRLPLGASHLPVDRVALADTAVTLSSRAAGSLVFVEDAVRWLPDGIVETGLVSNESAVVRPMVGNVPARAGRGATAASGGPSRILVADDNADMREYLRRLLSERYSVTTVANGVEALAAIQHASSALPHLVLTDVMMPELDGFGLLHALRSNPATTHIPVIMLSARAGEEATVEGLQAGADDYLVKPFSAREVISRIEARLEITRARAETERHARQVLDAILFMAQTLFNPPDDLASGQVAGADTPTREGRQDTSRSMEQLVAQRLALLMCDVIGCRRVSITSVNPETQVMRAVAVVGLTPEQEEQWWAEQRAQEARGTRLGEGADPDELARFRAGEVFVLDLTQPPYNTQPNPYGVTTEMIAPMRAGDQLVGILSLDYGGPKHIFTDDERALVGAVAQLGAVALEREHLLRVSAEAKAHELAAVEAKRQMSEFLGIASHELRTPLTSITANVQLARKQLERLDPSDLGASDDGAASDDHHHSQSSYLRQSALLLERTDKQLGRLDRLVGDLVDAARIQAGKLELLLEPSDLLSIVREAAHEQRAAWPHRSIRLNLPRRAKVPIYADADRIGQVVTNLLINALKYSRDETDVEVAVRILGGSVRVSVHDQGPGLSEEQQAHLWERFYRAPGIQQQSGSGIGLGLGLSICKTIVERHSGQVGVTSAPGEGSVFWFALPLEGAPLHM